MYIYQQNRNQKSVSGPKPQIDIYRDTDIVEKIKADYEDGRSVKGLMADYGVSRATIYRILKALSLT